MRNLKLSQPETMVHLEVLPEELLLLNAVLEQQSYQIQKHEYGSWGTTPEKYWALWDKISELCKALPVETADDDEDGSVLLMIARR